MGGGTKSEVQSSINIHVGSFHCPVGWTGLDDLYRIVPGELSVVTGVPNSGKSEWLDALLCNLVQQRGWNFALCSMENKVGKTLLFPTARYLLSGAGAAYCLGPGSTEVAILMQRIISHAAGLEFFAVIYEG